MDLNQKEQDILRIMVEQELTLIYFYVAGGCALRHRNGTFLSDPVSFTDFDSLKRGGYIEKTGEIGQGDVHLATNTKGTVHSITNKGSQYFSS